MPLVPTDVAATMTLSSTGPATALLQVAVASPRSEQLTVLSGGRPVPAECVRLK